MYKKAFGAFRNLSVAYSLSYAFIAGIFGMLLLQKGLSIAQVGLYMGAYSFFSILVSAPAGALADTYGRKKAIASAFACQFLFLVGLAFLPLGSWIVPLALLPAASDALFVSSAEAHAVDLLGRQKGRFTQRLLSSARSYEYAAILVASVIGGAISAQFLDAPVLVCAAFAASGFIYTILRVKEAQVKTHASQRPPALSKLLSGLSLSFKDSSIRTLLLVSFCLGAGFFSLSIYWQAVLQQMAGFGNEMFGLFFSLMTLSSIVGFWLSNKFKPSWKSIGWSMGGMFACLALSAIAPIAGLVMLLILGWELFWGIFVPVESAIINRSTPSAIRATVLSIKSLSYRAGMSLFGFSIYLSGASDPRQLWLCGAIFLLSGSALSLLQMGKERISPARISS